MANSAVIRATSIACADLMADRASIVAETGGGRESQGLSLLWVYDVSAAFKHRLRRRWQTRDTFCVDAAVFGATFKT